MYEKQNDVKLEGFASHHSVSFEWASAYGLCWAKKSTTSARISVENNKAKWPP